MKTLSLLLCISATFFGCNNPAENSTGNEKQPAEQEVNTSQKTTTEAGSQSAETTSNDSLNQEIKTASQIVNDTKINVKNIEKPFRKELKSGKVSFMVSSKNVASQNNKVIIRMQGFEVMNDSFIHEIKGQITHAEVADLNKDGFPELYVFYASPHGQKEGDIIAYGSNRNMSATPIYVRHPAKTQAVMKGYAGNDNFYIENNKLVRGFTVNVGGNEAVKQISYKLIRGETSLILEFDKTVNGKK